MPKTYTNDELYSLCPDRATPDWRQFDGLELGGCINVEIEGEAFVQGGTHADEAELFCIYGHLPRGGVVAITDVHGTFEDAERMLWHLSRASGLPFTVVC